MQFIDLKKQYLVLKEEIDSAISGVLSSAAFIGGKEVTDLSESLADYCGTKKCLTCANGTDALTLSLRVLGVGKGDAVFVPDFTFFASGETPALEGATCVFVDVDKRTFNMSPEKLRAAIKEVIKEGRYLPKCIITVDLFGLPADYPEIRKIADEYGLFIIEDGAQGFGGEIKGKRACSFGDISTTSFFPAKPLGCYGDGGAVFTDGEEYYALLSSLAVHGKGSFKYDNVRIGYNSRLDTVQAAILKVKLKAFKEYELAKRHAVAKEYDKRLEGKFVTPFIPDGFSSSYAQYTLITESNERREEILLKGKEKEIPLMVYYPKPLHLQTAFAGVKEYGDGLETAERLSKTVFSIPMHPYLEEKDIDAVTEFLIGV